MKSETVLDLCNLSLKLTKKLNQIRINYQHKYTDLIDDISHKYAHIDEWWVTPISSRNPSLCDSYDTFCLLILALQEIQEYPYTEIITNRWSLKKALEKNLINKKIRVMCTGRARRYIKNIWNAYYKVIRQFFLVKKITKGISYQLPEQLTFIDTYIVNTEFQNGSFVDRYFGSLREYVSDSTFFLGMVAEENEEKYKEIIKKVVDNPSFKILLREVFLKRRDLISILKYCIKCLGFLKRSVAIEGVDITPIYTDGILDGMSNVNAMMGILNIIFIKRFKKKFHYDIKKMIGWYEGQCSSNALFYALKKYYPNAASMAYVFTPCKDDYMCLAPSKEQYRRCAPKEFGVSGRIWFSFIKRFYEGVSCVLTPAFRYEYLYDKVKKEPRATAEKELLIVLPHTVKYARILLLNVFEAIKRLPYKMNISIKNHPINSNYTLERYGVETDANITYETGSMEKALEDKSMVIVCETSSSLEILIQGIPLIIFAVPDRGCNTYLPEKLFNREKFIAYNSEEICALIKDYTLRKKENDIDAEKILKECFEPVNEVGIIEFLERIN